MAKWERRRFEEDLRELIKQAETLGIEEAVRAFAARLREDYSPQMVQAHVDSLRAKRRIKGNDALTVYRVYEAHILSKFPKHIQILWSMFRRLTPSWAVSSKPERVVIRTPSSTGRILCPMVKAAGGDLEKARPICEALVRYEAFDEPVSILLAKAVNPRIHWEIEEYRERPDLPCYYAIVLET